MLSVGPNLPFMLNILHSMKCKNNSTKENQMLLKLLLTTARKDVESIKYIVIPIHLQKPGHFLTLVLKVDPDNLIFYVLDSLGSGLPRRSKPKILKPLVTLQFFFNRKLTELSQLEVERQTGNRCILHTIKNCLFFSLDRENLSEISNFELEPPSNYKIMINLLSKLILDRKFEQTLFESLKIPIVSSPLPAVSSPLPTSPLPTASPPLFTSSQPIDSSIPLFIKPLDHDDTILLELPEFYLMKSGTAIFK